MSQGMIKTKGAFSKKYAIGERLGRGKFAEVRKATEVNTHQKVAVKILDKERMRKSDFQKVYKELEILQKLRHKNVVRVYEAYETDDFFYIVMEYIGGGELFQKIVNTEHFSEAKVREIIEIIASALQYCMTEGVVHRDIKPDNILLTTVEEGEEIKIVDFNLSRALETEEVVFNLLETQCGTPNYVAPEVLSGNPYNFKCDVWSLGVILFVMLSGGYLPFILDPRDGEEKEALLAAVKRGVWNFEPEEAWANVSRDAKSLVLRMMDPDPNTRFDWDQVLAHPFMKTGKENTRAIKMGMSKQMKIKTQRKLLSCGLAIEAANAFHEVFYEKPPPPKVDTEKEIDSDFEEA